MAFVLSIATAAALAVQIVTLRFCARRREGDGVSQGPSGLIQK